MAHKMKEVHVKIGNRVYDTTSWRRRDFIFYNGKKIGVINLTEHDRMGTTTCIATSERRPGRAIDWCVQVAIKRHIIAPPGFALSIADGQNIAAAA